MVYFAYLLYCLSSFSEINHTVQPPLSSAEDTTIYIYENGKEVAQIYKENKQVCFYKKGICVGILSPKGEVLVGRSHFTKGWLQQNQLMSKDKKHILKNLQWHTSSPKEQLYITTALSNKCGIVAENHIKNIQGATIATWESGQKVSPQMYQIIAVYVVYFSDWQLC